MHKTYITFVMKRMVNTLNGESKQEKAVTNNRTRPVTAPFLKLGALFLLELIHISHSSSDISCFHV